MKHQQSSEYLEAKGYSLHLRKLTPHQGQQGVVLLLHGAIENGRIFYSASGKGLASFLADHGMLVYCADFAGRGASKPHVRDGFDQSQHQLICHDIPLLIETLAARHGCTIHLMAHSWGGVVAVASLVRFAHLRSLVASQVYFGSKRHISVNSVRRRITIDLIWNRVAPWLARRYGYLPAKRFKLGADDEPKRYLADTIAWITAANFVDVDDGFDYGAAAASVRWMPSLFYAAIADTVLGHPHDVQAFMREANIAPTNYRLLARQSGDAVDFDHVSMLTHPNAVTGHFLQLLDWLEQVQAGPQ